MPKLSIHLITWNGEKYLDECLNSIFEQTFKDYLLLVIDNGSVDQTAKIIENNFLPIFGDRSRFLKNKENLGFAKAHNQALLWTDSEYVMILNQDVILEPDFFSQAIEFLDKHKDAGSVSGKVLRWQLVNNEVIKDSQKTDIIDSLGLQVFKNQRIVDLSAGLKDQGQYGEVKEIFGPSAVCPIYRRQALADVRYNDEFFDNDFFSYKEDVDLAYRLRWRAWKSFYLPKAVAYHDRRAKGLGNESWWSTIKNRRAKSKYINFYSYKNHLFILKKNLSWKIFGRYFFNITFYEFKKFCYLLLFERKTLSSLKDFFGKYKSILAKRKFVMANRLIKDEEIRKWFN